MNSNLPIIVISSLIFTILTTCATNIFAQSETYWVSTNLGIIKSRIDGSDKQTVLTGPGQPYRMTFNAVDNKVYWISETGERIQRSDISGNQVENIITESNNLEDLVIDETNQKLYYIDRGASTIFRCDFSGANQQVVLDGLSFPSGIALDIANNLMYFSVANNNISSCNLDGSNVQQVTTTGGEVGQISPDLSTGKLYWTEVGSIHRVNTNGTNPETLLSGLNFASALVVHPSSGLMYFTEVVGQGKISSANLDGSNKTVLVTGNNIIVPFGLAIDFAAQVMYFPNDRSDIFKANLNGTNVQVFLEEFNVYDIVIDPVSKDIYYTRGNDVLKYDGTTNTLLYSNWNLETNKLVVDKQHGKIYWTDNNQIHQMNLDGSNFQAGIFSGVFSLELVIDITQQKLYWTQDAGSSYKINRGNVDGSGFEELQSGLRLPLDLFIDQGAQKIYYLDLIDEVVGRMDLDGGDHEPNWFTVNRPRYGFINQANQEMLLVHGNGFNIYNVLKIDMITKASTLILNGSNLGNDFSYNTNLTNAYPTGNPVCNPPQFTTNVISDCEFEQYTIEVNISNKGDASTVRILNSGDNNAIEDAQINQVYTIGPFADSDIETVMAIVQNSNNSCCETVEYGLSVACDGLAIDELEFYGSSSSNGNLIDWNMDINTIDEISIERSSNGKTGWTLLKSFEGRNLLENYSFLDLSPTDIAFYRLFIKWKNGTESYSDVITIQANLNQKLVVFPNPSTDYVQVTLPNNQGSLSELFIYNAVGQPVFYQKTFEPSIILELNGWTKGVYWMKAQVDGKIRSGKFIKL